MTNLETDATPHDVQSREYFNPIEEVIKPEDVSDPQTKRIDTKCACGMDMPNTESWWRVGSWWAGCPECGKTFKVV